MRKFWIRPTTMLRGRTSKGIRGWSGKPTHPSLTDFLIVAYMLGAFFGIVATFGRDERWAHDVFRAGTSVFAAGCAISLVAVVTGFGIGCAPREGHPGARRTA